MKERLKILHIIHDEKFIDWFLDKFSDDKFLNKKVLLNKNISYKGKHLQNIHHIIPFSPSYFALIKEANEFDIIFFYNLEYWKAYIANRVLNSKVLLIWNFFGTELYNDHFFPNKSLYGSLTRQNIRVDKSIGIKKYLRPIKYFLKGRLTPEKEVAKAITRVNYFAWYSEDEYKYLKARVGNLPQFLRYPLTHIEAEKIKNTNNSVRIILGNSRAPENNHFDALNIVEEAKYKGEILLPISYGGNDDYIEKLKVFINSLNIRVIQLETFMEYKEYMKEIDMCTTAIFNSYRQLALGNLFMVLNKGIKLYLNTLNPSYQWFKNLGFHVYSVEEHLRIDIEKDKLTLDDNLKIQNQLIFNRITSQSNTNEFLESLSLLITNNCN